MKKFLVGFALPAAAAIAVVGSGFSVWYFGDKAQDESNASINVTELVQIGKFTQDANSKIVLDQTTEGREANANGLGKELEAKGIYMTGANEGWKGTISYEKSDSDTVEGKVKTEIKTYIFLPKAVDTYIEVKKATLDAAFTKYEVTEGVAAVKSFTSENYVSYVYTWGEETTISLPKTYKDDTAFFYMTYKGGKEPTNDTEYKAMKAAMNGKTVSIVSEATLVKAGA